MELLSLLFIITIIIIIIIIIAIQTACFVICLLCRYFPSEC
jgi:hypothetical protein